MEKKKLDPVTRIKMYLAIEYGIIVLVFATLGTLFLTEVIKVQEWKRYAFTYVTLIGGAWIVTDFIWTLRSKKRRANSSLLDKCLILPVGLALIGFDIYFITTGCAESPLYRYVIGTNLCMIALIYAFENAYHGYHPIPGIIEAALADEQKPEPKPEEKPEEEKPEQGEEK